MPPRKIAGWSKEYERCRYCGTTDKLRKPYAGKSSHGTCRHCRNYLFHVWPQRKGIPKSKIAAEVERKIAERKAVEDARRPFAPKS